MAPSCSHGNGGTQRTCSSLEERRYSLRSDGKTTPAAQGPGVLDDEQRRRGKQVRKLGYERVRDAGNLNAHVRTVEHVRSPIEAHRRVGREAVGGAVLARQEIDGMRLGLVVEPLYARLSAERLGSGLSNRSPVFRDRAHGPKTRRRRPPLGTG